MIDYKLYLNHKNSNGLKTFYAQNLRQFAIHRGWEELLTYQGWKMAS